MFNQADQRLLQEITAYMTNQRQEEYNRQQQFDYVQHQMFELMEFKRKAEPVIQMLLAITPKEPEATPAPVTPP